MNDVELNGIIVICVTKSGDFNIIRWDNKNGFTHEFRVVEHMQRISKRKL